MNGITAVVDTVYENGRQCLRTHFFAECGCDWTVDMWGLVRRVAVCPDCTRTPEYYDQMGLELTPLVDA